MGAAGLSRVASLEYGPRGIGVNLVNPGYVETPILADAAPGVSGRIHRPDAGRAGRHAEDVASLVLFLLSDRSEFVNGAEISIDGGFAAHGGAKVILDAIDRAAE